MDNVMELKNAVAALKEKIALLENNLEEPKHDAVAVVEEASAPRGPGRPPHFSSVEQMQTAIDQYFDDADAKKWPYTIPDLALALGFTSRQSLLNYQYKPEYMDTIKRAKLRIEGQRARQLVKGQGVVAGQIFDLKNNFGWCDEPESAGQGSEPAIVQNNIGLIGFPPKPKNIEEWEEWYHRYTGSKVLHETTEINCEVSDCLDVE